MIQDDNADYSKTKIEYQDHGVWQVLDAIPGEQGVFRLPESATHDVGLVRATDGWGDAGLPPEGTLL